MKYFTKLLKNWEIEKVEKMLSDSKWGFGFTSTDPDRPIWNFDNESGKVVAELVASKLEGYELTTWNINGQTIGQHGSWHIDQSSICTHVFIYFFQHWKYDWGGRLHLQTNDKDTTIITPERNTGILFDASIYHYAEAPIIDNIIRMSVGLKLLKTG